PSGERRAIAVLDRALLQADDGYARLPVVGGEWLVGGSSHGEAKAGARQARCQGQEVLLGPPHLQPVDHRQDPYGSPTPDRLDRRFRHHHLHVSSSTEAAQLPWYMPLATSWTVTLRRFVRTSRLLPARLPPSSLAEAVRIVARVARWPVCSEPPALRRSGEVLDGLLDRGWDAEHALQARQLEDHLD